MPIPEAKSAQTGPRRHSTGRSGSRQYERMELHQQPLSDAVGIITTFVVLGLVSLVMYVDYRGWRTAWASKLVEQYQQPSGRWRFLMTRSTRAFYSDPIRVRRIYRISSGVGLLMSVAVLVLEAVALVTRGLR